MKEKNISRIIAAFACGLTVVALVEIHGLNKKLENMEQNMNNGFYQVSENVNAIDNRIYAAMEEETNLLALQNWEYKEVDVASKKVKVQAEVLPKEYFPEKTEAVLIYEEKEYPMTFSNGKYTAVLDIPLCEESVVESVVFKEDGTNRSQKLEWYLSPRTEYLPYVYARFEGSTTGSASGEMYQYSGDGLLVTEVNQKKVSARSGK